MEVLQTSALPLGYAAAFDLIYINKILAKRHPLFGEISGFEDNQAEIKFLYLERSHDFRETLRGAIASYCYNFTSSAKLFQRTK